MTRESMLLVVGAVAIQAGCFRGDVDLSGRACPCAGEWQCVGGVCVLPGAIDAGRPIGMDSSVLDARAPDAALAEDGGSTEDGGVTTDSGPGPGMCPPDPACTLYVAPGGDDTALGRLTAPFATLQHAMDVAMPGDVVCARAGTYETVVIAHSGEPGSPIVLRSFPGEVANVRGRGVSLFAGWGIEVGWIWILDLDIEQDSGTPTSTGECIYLHSAHDSVIRGNTLHDCIGFGIAGNAANLLVDSNRIRDVAAFAVADPVGHATFYGVALSGTAIHIVNNLIYDNAAGGVLMDGTAFDPADPNHPASALYAGADDWLVSNNLLALNLNVSGIRITSASAMNALIQNNIFYENGQDGSYANAINGIEFASTGIGTIVRNNLYFGTGATIVDSRMGGGSYVETAPVGGDPSFVDVPTRDFHLRTGSPAIDTGVVDRAPAFDRDCVTRSGMPDLGAYER